jgi:tRNA-dihydrouridine synthase B
MVDHANFFQRNRIAEKRAQVRALYAHDEVLLSPMAGVTDLVFRAICRDHGADVTFCEFASADGVVHGNQSTRELIELAEDEHPVGIQLFGSDPGSMAEAAREAEKLGPDLIDLNFGCPVKKVVKKNGGSALLCNVPLMEDIVRAVVEATALPVTAKTRLGWSQGSLNYLETTQMLQEAGACAITMHGRTRDQKFTGIADWTPIAEMKDVAEVPVIGNGDVWNGEDYRRIKSETGCDAVMIARAAIGNPFVFEEIDAVRRGIDHQPPDVDRVVTVLVDHLDREIALKGPRTGMNRMKRHFAAYLKGCPGVAELRKRVFATNDRDEVVAAFEDYRARNAGFRPEPARGRRAA